jgi:serine phosphatase RsbU (regulator of sigma subunit)
MPARIIQITIVVIGLLLAAISTLFFIREATMVSSCRVSGTLSSRYYVRGQSTLEFLEVDSADFISPPYPRSGDTIVTIGDTAAVAAVWDKYFDFPHKPGMEVPIRFVSHGDTLSVMARTRLVKTSDLAGTGLIMILRFLLNVSYLALGFWAFFKRRESGAVRALTLFCFAMTSFLMSAVQLGIENYASFSIPHWSLLRSFLGAFSIFFGSFWLNLTILFPSPRRMMTDHPLWGYLLCYLPMTAVVILSIIFQTAALGTVAIALVTIQICTGFFLLGWRHFTSHDPLEKRQTRLVLWGSGVGLLSLAGLVILAVFAADWLRHLFTIYTTMMICGVFLALLLSPLSFAYAFGRYRLLEIEGRIRRGTRHLLTSIVLLAVFYLLIYAVGESLLSVLGVESRTPVLAAALALAIGFAPAQRRLMTLLDRWIYPERARLKGMLNDFIRGSLASADAEVFWTGLENRLKTALKVDSVYPVVRALGNGHFVHWRGGLTPFDLHSAFIGEISKTGGRPIMRDEMEASRRAILTTDESNWFGATRLALVLPMITRSELVGFLGIGFKSDEQDFEPADLEILQSLTSQIAVATDNLRLLEENVEKKRMEAELSIARKVQEGMLPHDLPITPGLDVAACSRFCTEVAGDYYDVIDMPDGKTVLAIGDVSGKGAGAALLMSNVQASLRTAIGVGSHPVEPPRDGTPLPSQRGTDIRLGELVASINCLICRNSQPDQFITFFVAIFDPVGLRLEYVNAGHNPPLVARADGTIEELTEGGLLLGALPDVPFSSGIVQVAEDDVVFLYTDGLSESMRSDEEMFGEERIKEFLVSNRTVPSEELLSRLEREVEVFLGDAQLGDDFTLVAASILRKRP